MADILNAPHFGKRPGSLGKLGEVPVESCQGLILGAHGQVQRISEVHAFLVPAQRVEQAVALAKHDVRQPRQEAEGAGDFGPAAIADFQHPSQFEQDGERRGQVLRSFDDGARPLEWVFVTLEQVAGQDVGVQGDHDLLASSRALSMRESKGPGLQLFSQHSRKM